MLKYLSVVLGLTVVACSSNYVQDSGIDGGLTGPRGLVRWGTQPCIANDAGPGGADTGTHCAPASQHASNTAVNVGARPGAFTCHARATGDGLSAAVAVTFHADETQYVAQWPGSIELSGTMAGTPTAIGMPLTDCTVTFTEGALTGTGTCGHECVVTVTKYTEATHAISGTIKCSGISAGDPDPNARRLVRNPDGVPLPAAEFDIVDCDTL